MTTLPQTVTVWPRKSLTLLVGTRGAGCSEAPTLTVVSIATETHSLVLIIDEYPTNARETAYYGGLFLIIAGLAEGDSP